MNTSATPESADFITISRKEYDALVKRDAWLSYLEAAGVDNWDGCSYAHEMKESDETKRPAS